jgi:hypothetical protein
MRLDVRAQRGVPGHRRRAGILVAVFRRRASADTTLSPGSDASEGGLQVDDKFGGKGRPTPKRRESEQQRRERVKPPQNRKEAYRLQRQRAKTDRAKARKGLLTGDQRALPPRDQGPVKAFVRDFIDARRSVAEYFLPIAVVVLVASFIDLVVVRAITAYGMLLLLVMVFVDSLMIARTLRKQIGKRFPKDSPRGAVGYGIMRSLQMRRLRLPPPRVKPGATI